LRPPSGHVGAADLNDAAVAVMQSEQSLKPIQEKVMGFLVFGPVFSGFSFQSSGAEQE
tara:strand:- start:808 stop:981 length:174 start_codon:yes stop_codon:yes gene_type:complete